MNLDDTIANTLSAAPRQKSAIVLREFTKAFRVLPGTQRKALLLTAIEGHPQVSRGRAALRRLLANEGANVSLRISRDTGGFAPPFQQGAGADPGHTQA